MPPSSSPEEKGQGRLRALKKSMGCSVVDPLIGSSRMVSSEDCESDVESTMNLKKNRGGRKKKRTPPSPEEPDSVPDAVAATRDINPSLRREGKAGGDKKNRGKKKDRGPKGEDAEGYESDAGTSYRQYCLRRRSLVSKTCLKVPKMLKNSISTDDTVATPPASPTVSETDDDWNVPASIPPETAGVRYSLRSVISDGSERQIATESVMERRPLRPNRCHFDTSHWSHMGLRPYMEDRYIIEELGSVKIQEFAAEMNLHPEPNAGGNSLPICFFGVFDGHGGEKASQFCSDWITSYVRHQQCYPYDLGYAMKSAFLAIDDDFIGTGYPDGTTACAVAIVGGQRIVCANAGDSRAIVVQKDGSIVRISRDHKPGVPDETRRITDLGGKVVYWGRWRVEGLLAVSRSIGDAGLKPYISADPEVCEYDIGKNDSFLVVASDGIWDGLDNAQVAQILLSTACRGSGQDAGVDPNRLKWTARRLCEHAIAYGSTDNVTAVVVDLQSYQNRASKLPW